MNTSFKSWKRFTPRKRHHLTLVSALALGLCPVAPGFLASTSSADRATVVAAFAGSSPCSESIRPLLQIPSEANADLIHWTLTLYRHPQTLAPAGYKLRCDYGPAVPNLPGLGKMRSTVQKEGAWTIAKGITSNPDAVVYELSGAVALSRVDENILHVLNPDRSLMIGSGGWSYTLNRVESSEKPGELALALTRSSAPRTISPMATGPAVFGVFEGRTPCQGISRELNLPEDAGCLKAKWRVTLYQNPETRTPTTCKVEGTLYGSRAREGRWSIIRGTETGPNAIVYFLEPTPTDPGLFLLKGDDNVLFFLGQNRKALVGHAEFSYTLNRRNTASTVSRASQLAIDD